MKISRLFILQPLIVIFFIFALSCNDSGSKNVGADSAGGGANSIQPDTSTSLIPQSPKPDWAPDIHPEMQVVIEKLASYKAPAIETLTASEARKNPTPSMAVMDVVKEHNIKVPVAPVDTVGVDIPVKSGSIHLRIYTPRASKAMYPLVLYIHGGGWVIADINTYDASAAAISAQTDAIVVSVNYRQGPEHKFPTAHQDCFAAYQWMLKNASSIKGDTSKIAVVGESAGGNLAANVSIMARDQKIKTPLTQILVYPIAQTNTNTASYQKNAMAKPLNRAMMVWFFKNYLASMKSLSDPRIDLTKAKLMGLPPTTIITAELDPLQSDGQMLRDHLKTAGVDVTYQNYDGVTHEFFGMAAVVPEAKQAQAFAVSQIKKYLQN